MTEQLVKQIEQAQRQGDIDGLIDLQRQLLSLHQQYGNVEGEILSLIALGNTYQIKGQLQRAHNYRVEAAKLAEDTSSNCSLETQMTVIGDLGRSFFAAHDFDNAEVYTQRALDIAKNLDDEYSECIYNLNLGGIYGNRGRLTEAINLGEKVVDIAGRLQNHYLQGKQYGNLAAFCLEEARISESQRYARQALVHADLSGRIALRAETRLIFGQSYLRAGLITGNFEYYAEAERQLQQVIELAQATGNSFWQAEATKTLAQVHRATGSLSESIKHYQQTIETLEEVRSSLGHEEFRLTFFKGLENTYHQLVESLLKQGLPHQAFLNTERLRSRELLAVFGQKRNNTQMWSESQSSELSETLDLYGHEVTSMWRKSQTINFKAPNIVAMEQKFRKIYETQRLSEINFSGTQAPTVVSIEEAKTLLGPNDALLAYLVTDQSVIAFAATDEAFHFQHLTYSQEKIANDIAELYLAVEAIEHKVLRDPIEWVKWAYNSQDQVLLPPAIEDSLARFHKSAEKLFALLIVPLLPVIFYKKHWVIMPYGPLHRVPWAALRVDNQYLIEQYSLSLLPSASLGVALKNNKVSSQNEAIFFANPDNSLPETKREAEASYKVFGNGPAPFIGAEATKSKFVSKASNAQLLHLGCHHLYNPGDPYLSFLKLAGERGSEFLYAFEVAELSLNATLVSLAACDSGLSRIETGDEQIGMPRAFLSAGARSVVSTLWPAEDKAASRFFTCFYSYAKEIGVGESMAKAQRDLLSEPRFSLPYFWAPYLLSGQWNITLEAN